MIRIGLLGASRIARGAIIEPATHIEGVEVTSVAARDPDRAAEFAAEHGIQCVEQDYESLISSDKVDLVYVGLPPSGHAKWSIAALDAGRHVLCEKPFAMNADEARAMVDAAKTAGTVLIEAFHHRFHPAYVRMLDLVASGSIGKVRSLYGRFNVPITYTPTEIRYVPELGGGAMMDLGCYPVHWVRSVTGAEPDVVSASGTKHETGVDTAMEADLVFPGGVTATVECSMSEDLPDGLDVELRVTGETGIVTMTNPLVPHTGHEIIIENESGAVTEQAAGETTYYHQLEHVVAVIMGQAGQITGGGDSIGNMMVLDEIYRRSGIRPA